MSCRTLGLLAALLLPAAAQAWGPEGHRASAAITSERLCPEVQAAVERLLQGMTLAEAANWPDRIRGEPRWAHTREWHYLNIGDDEAFSAVPQDEPGRGRLLAAIGENRALLADAQAEDARRREALSFVIHLVGDLHQPLHIGRMQDRGGHRITVRFEERETNLHRLWDGALLRSAGLRADDYQRMLAPLVLLGAPDWERGSPEDWAEESRQLRPWVYDFDQRRRVPLISRRYAETGRQLTALRIAQAGVRTAWLLNETLGPCEADASRPARE